MMLNSKVALITGGSSGIGLAIAERFLKEGAKVVISGRSKERCDAAQKQLEVIAAEAVDSATGDVSKWVDVQTMVEKTVNRFGRIDILVNNAGIYLEKRLEETTEEEWDQLININLKSVFLCSKAVYPYSPRWRWAVSTRPSATPWQWPRPTPSTPSNKPTSRTRLPARWASRSYLACP